MKPTRTRRQRELVAVALLSTAALLTSACGSSQSDSQKESAAADTTSDASTAPTEESVPTQAEAPPVSTDEAIPGATPVPDPASAPQAPAPSPTKGTSVPTKQSASAPATPAAPARPAPVGDRPPAKDGGKAEPAPAPASAGAVAPAPPEPVPGQPGAGGAAPEIVIGSIGTRSGVIGGILAPIEQGAKAWVADLNGRGGFNGRKVRIVFGDDQGDPNRAVALVRRMIDEDKVSAFYAEQGPGTLQAVMPHLEQKQIPMFTVCNCSDGAAQSTMAFNATFGGYLGMTWSHLMPAKLSGAKKASLFACRELSICQRIKRQMIDGLAESAGLEIVHDADISLAQPDFTAEVLGARNAGAEVLIIMADNFTVARVARSAHRQNYDPKIAFQMTGHDERFLKEGGSDIEGAIFGSSAPDWNLPSMKEFRTAAARTNAVLSSMTASSWIAGKLIESVARSFPPSGPVASTDFLRGLYGLQGETLGGLTPPLTYKEGASHDPSNQCVFPVKVEKGKFLPMNEGNYLCPPGWQPVQK